MTHSAEEPSQRFYQKWSRFERMVVIVLTFAVLGMIGQAVTQRATDHRQDAQTAQVAKEARQCLADRLDALRGYLAARGELADRDRASNNRVIRSFAEAARTGTQDRTKIIRVLREWEAEQKEIAELRQNEPLPDFPGGDCLGQTSVKPGDRATEKPPPDEPLSQGAISGDGAVSSPSPTRSPRADGGSSGGNEPTGGGSGNGGGGSGGGDDDGGSGGDDDPSPTQPSNGDEELVDLELHIPDLLKVEFEDGETPKVTPEPGGLLDPEGTDE